MVCFNEQLVGVIQYFFDTLYGTVIMFLLAGVPTTKKNLRSMVVMTGICFGVIAGAIFWRGLDNFSRVYALCVHLPYALFFVFYFRRPVTTTLLALIFAYFSSAPRFLFGNVSVWLFDMLNHPIDDMVAKRIGWMFNGPILFWPVYKFLVPPLRDLIHHSTKSRPQLLVLVGSCYLFAQAAFGFMTHPLQAPFFILFLFAFLVSLVEYSRKQRQLEEISARMVAYSVQNEGLALYAESMAGYLEDTARLRHDHRHFLTLLDLQAARGNLDGVRNLIGESLATLSASPERVSGSGIVDAIVALFRKRAAEQGVSIEITGKDLLSLPMPENDLCLLLSNCLDNAIDATRRAEGGSRVVSLAVSRNAENGAVSLIARNPCPEAVSFASDGLPQSAKGPGHGYGTSSIRTIVKKHGGVCGFSIEGGEFFLRVAFLPQSASVKSPASKATPRAASPLEAR